MALFGALNTSAQAMNAHSHHMGSIGTNIANVNTTAYKKVETLYQTQKNHVSPKTSFFAVNTVDVRRNSIQGVLAQTGRAMDVAINGPGFFVTNTQSDGSGETRFTRAGTFTGEAYLTGADSNGDGNPDQGTRLKTLGGDYVMGYKANDDGTFGTSLGPIDFSNDTLDPGRATSTVTVRGNLPAANGSTKTHQMNVPVIRQKTTNGVAGTETKNVNLTFSPTNGVAGSWSITPSGSSGIASVSSTPANLVFKGDGTLDTTATGGKSLAVVINYSDGTSQNVTVDLENFTQYSGETDLSIRRMDSDGVTSGTLSGTYFNKFGVLIGRFSNAVDKPLYKLPLATFPSPEKLEALQGNVMRQTQESGAATIAGLEAGDAVAEILGGNLEMSNVNLEDQFSKMITTQRAYSSAATVFRTSDEMSQTARDLVT